MAQRDPTLVVIKTINATNSINTDDGIKVGATYEAGEDRIESVDTFISQVGESEEVRAETYRESLGWYDSITSDMFG